MGTPKLQEASSFDAFEFKKLRQLVAQGEGKHLEFKRKATYPEKVIREMIAFANTNGGVVLIGVDDDRNIPGLKHPEDESHVIHKALALCRPSLQVAETFIPIGNARSVIRYDVAESKRKPHYILNGDGVRESFVRVADQSIRASREVREIFRRGQQKKDIRFHYGEHEQILMRYLDEHPTITLPKVMELCSLSRFNASRKLIILVLADVLRVTPHERGDLYSLAFA